MFKIEKVSEGLIEGFADDVLKKEVSRYLEDTQTLARELLESYYANPAKPEKIGEGMSAEVFLCRSNPGIVFKVIKVEPGENGVYYNTFLDEMDLMERVYKLDSKVHSPMPLFCVINEGSGESQESDIPGLPANLRIMAMKTVKGATIKDVVYGKSELPMQFDFFEFYEMLEKYLVKMHDEARVYHRDLHAGNIMIDHETGRPWVIDFGASIYASGLEKPYYDKRMESGKEVWIPHLTDEQAMGDAMKELRLFLEARRARA